jgi:lipid-binding SYLF domain-containing protein
MQSQRLYIFLTVVLLIVASPLSGMAESAREMRRSASQALTSLYSSTPASRALGEQAAGVLVFPEILKGGFIVAAQYGNGVLFKKGKAVGYYNTTSGSFGFQAGVQSFGYALFFMTQEDLTYLERSGGWEIGVGPSITIVDVGLAGSLYNNHAQRCVCLFLRSKRPNGRTRTPGNQDN